MSWTILKAAIAAAIKTNNNQEITGAVLQNTLNSIVNSVGANATFAGVATPSTNPGTPDGPVFWLAGQSGQYSNFDNTEIESGFLTVFLWDGSTWSHNSIEVGSSGSGAYDISEKTGLSYASLSGALAAVPSNKRRGGMTIAYVDSTTNKYVQYRLMSTTWSTTVGDWQGVDEEPTAGSKNLVESGGVSNAMDVLSKGFVHYNKLDRAIFLSKYIKLSDGSTGNSSGHVLSIFNLENKNVFKITCRCGEGNVATPRAAVAFYSDYPNIGTANYISGYSVTAENADKTYIIPANKIPSNAKAVAIVNNTNIVSDTNNTVDIVINDIDGIIGLDSRLYGKYSKIQLIQGSYASGIPNIDYVPSTRVRINRMILASELPLIIDVPKESDGILYGYSLYSTANDYTSFTDYNLVPTDNNKHLVITSEMLDGAAGITVTFANGTSTSSNITVADLNGTTFTYNEGDISLLRKTVGNIGTRLSSAENEITVIGEKEDELERYLFDIPLTPTITFEQGRYNGTTGAKEISSSRVRINRMVKKSELPVKITIPSNVDAKIFAYYLYSTYEDYTSILSFRTSLDIKGEFVVTPELLGNANAITFVFADGTNTSDNISPSDLTGVTFTSNGIISEIDDDIDELEGDIDELEGDIDELEGDIDELNYKLYGENLTPAITIEQGRYSSTGEKQDNIPTRCRIDRMIKASELPVVCTIPSNDNAIFYQYKLYSVVEDYTSLIYAGSISSGKTFNITEELLNGAAGIGIAFSANNTTDNITPSDLTGITFKHITDFDKMKAMIVKSVEEVEEDISDIEESVKLTGNHTYYGRAQTLQITDEFHKMNAEQILQHTYSTYEYTIPNQSLAIWDGKYFCFNDTNHTRGFCVVINMTDNQVIERVETAPVEIGGSHLNNAQFTDLFYTVNDKYPLLILSRGDYASGSASDEAFHVVRITEESGHFVFTHIKKVLINTKYTHFNNSVIYDAARNYIWSYAQTQEWTYASAGYSNFDSGKTSYIYSEAQYICVSSKEPAVENTTVTVTVAGVSNTVSVNAGEYLNYVTVWNPNSLGYARVKAVSSVEGAIPGMWVVYECDENGDNKVEIVCRNVIIGFECPNLVESEQISLTETDIKNLCYIDSGIFQGGSCANGKLFMPYQDYHTVNGQPTEYTGHCCLVVNPVNGYIETVIPTDSMENEGCAIYNGDLYISVHWGAASEEYPDRPSFKILKYSF